MSGAVLLLPLYAFIAYISTRSHVWNSVPTDCIEVCDIYVCHSNIAENSHLLGRYAMAIVALTFVTSSTILITDIISYTAAVLEFFSVKI
jgi:hypothetical protein